MRNTDDTAIAGGNREETVYTVGVVAARGFYYRYFKARVCFFRIDNVVMIPFYVIASDGNVHFVGNTVYRDRTVFPVGIYVTEITDVP